ncbi:MAG: hypothetical protein FWF44_05575 [Defluviitaleaceae bacterium]|nr:hypothetical protein [Defluviitaleaceae bacterium]
MEDYWIIAGNPFYSDELACDINSIQLLEDESTDRRFRPSELLLKYHLQQGYLTPGDFTERFTQTGGRYADIHSLEVFDRSGNHTATIDITRLFGLFASWDCMEGNGWIE